MGLYDNGGGALTLDEYFHSVGREAAGDAQRLSLLCCTVSESTMNLSIRDCLLANKSAPFPRMASISYDESVGINMVAMGLMGDEDFWVTV